jgi:CSLREA domain-containing protein
MSPGRVATAVTAVLLLATGAATARDFHVNSLDDRPDKVVGDRYCYTGIRRDGGLECTLRAAVQEATFGSSRPGGEAYRIFLPAGLYELRRPHMFDTPSGVKSEDDAFSVVPFAEQSSYNDLDVGGAVEIIGDGPTRTIIDGGGTSRIFEAYGDGSVAISGVTLRNGGNEGIGGALRVGGYVALVDARIENCRVDPTVGYGSAIHADAAQLILRNVYITDCVGAGPAVYNAKDMYVYGSTITRCQAVSEDHAFLPGGAIGNIGRIHLDGSTLSHNTDAHRLAIAGLRIGVGGLHTSGPTYITNSTISGNSGVGIEFAYGYRSQTFPSTSTAYITDSTITDNEIGAWAMNPDTPIRLERTIFADNHQINCGRPAWDIFATSEFSIVGPDPVCQLTGIGNLTRTDPRLGSLADNGGPTWTHGLMITSPAVDIDPGWMRQRFDQRGVPRPQLNAYDAGAYELVGFPYRRDALIPNEVGGIPINLHLPPGGLTAFAFALSLEGQGARLLGADPVDLPEGWKVAVAADGRAVSVSGRDGKARFPKGRHGSATLARVRVQGMAPGEVTLKVSKSEIVDAQGTPVVAPLEAELWPLVVRTAPNQPPVARAGGDQVIECHRPFTLVRLDGSRSDDPDDVALQSRWTDAAAIVIGRSSSAYTVLPVGDHTFTLHVEDPHGAISSDRVRVSVVDRHPPVFAGLPTKVALPDGQASSFARWRPKVTDACDAKPVVSSDAPAVFPPGATHVTLTARDASGNVARARVIVQVPERGRPR